MNGSHKYPTSPAEAKQAQRERRARKIARKAADRKRRLS